MKQKITNKEVRRRIFLSTDKAKSVADVIQQARLRWVGHVHQMDEKHLTQKVMFVTRGSSWKKSRGGQQLTWQSNMKKIVKDLAVAEACRLPGWDRRDSSHRWLITLQDMARNRRQWRTCCHCITTK